MLRIWIAVVEKNMSIITVRGLEPSVKAALQRMAAEHGRSMEAEIRAVLTSVTQQSATKPGLAELIRDHLGGLTLELPERNEYQREVTLPS